MWRYEQVRFVLCGALGAGVNFASRLLYAPFMALTPSVVLAYFNGMLVSFFLFQRHVFPKGRKKWQWAMLVFACVNLVSMLITLLTTLWLAHAVLPWLGLQEHVATLAHACGIAAPLPFAYWAHKNYSFS